MTTVRKVSALLLLFIFCSYHNCFAENPKNHIDISKYDFQEGDILFQSLGGGLCKLIEAITKSPYSHCGIIAKIKNKLYVLEAIPPAVRYTPLFRWLNRGSHPLFTQIRIKGMTTGKIQKVLDEADKFIGFKYDFQYEISDKKIYCSELIYKAFKRALKLEIGSKQTLGSMNWKPYEHYIRQLAIPKGSLPLKRVMVTPKSLAKSQKAILIYTSYSISTDTDK